MVSIIVSFGMIMLLFMSGSIYESLKRLLMLITDIILKILNLFGIKINTKEYRIKTSHNFKKTFKDIKVVKRSKENHKIKPSINKTALIILILSILTVIINLNAVSGNFISKWLFKHNPIPTLIKTQESMDATFIAVLFSIISFSISKLISQWKETAKFRRVKREMRKKEKLLCKMSAKELLDAAKQKDLDGYNSHLKNNNLNNRDNAISEDEDNASLTDNNQKHHKKRSDLENSNIKNF